MAKRVKQSGGPAEGQLSLFDDPVVKRREAQEETARLATEGFVCDVMHVCDQSRAGGGYHCMDNYVHDLEGAHLFGTTCHGAGDEVWPGPTLVSVGRCDLAPGRGHGYALVHNDLVRVYPLDPGSGSWEASALSFTRYCNQCGKRMWGIPGTDFEACEACDEGRGVLLDFDGTTRTYPMPRPHSREQYAKKSVVDPDDLMVNCGDDEDQDDPDDGGEEE